MTRFTLTPDQQRRLIAYALEHLTQNGNGHQPHPKRKPAKKSAGQRNWSAKQRRAAAKRMSDFWTAKRRADATASKSAKPKA